jgi:hypothetical protein
MGLSATKLNETKDLRPGPWHHRALLCYQLGYEEQAGAQSTQANVPLSGMSISSTCERRTSALQDKLIKHSHFEAIGAGMRDQARLRRRARA